MKKDLSNIKHLQSYEHVLYVDRNKAKNTNLSRT